MNIAIRNVTFSSASVTWSHNHYMCPDKFYRVMYRPNWNNILSGFSKQNFHREEDIPLSHNSLTLQKLTPSTNYILCVTCHGTRPSRDQCTIFHTMTRDAVVPDRKRLDLALVIWLISSGLLIIVTMILLYGCLRMWCRKCKRTPKGSSSSEPTGISEGNTQAWHGGDAETAFTDDVFQVPTLIVLDRFSETKPDGLLKKTLGEKRIHLPIRKAIDTCAFLPQNASA
ncbi:fibronectin type III domain-containing protein 9-like [Rhinatrema bivittatum]|uniref:fibronectin type III domain-containing protein 9-like n=1 Tax=Rhinatrema bivittatum TaxID=194408 RepID=UPI00112D4D49|nr:fibronectin type III domain-containing protein 9-like [Rhinatrema bivittatum]